MIQFLAIALGTILIGAFILLFGLVWICLPLWHEERRARQIEATYKAWGERE